MHPGFHEGMLWKKSKETGQFLKRKFVLAEREFSLSYYNKENVSSPGASAQSGINIMDANYLYHNSEACPCPVVLQESKGPKAVIFIKDLNAMFQPEKIAHPHGLQITFHNDGPTRNLYVYHESGEVAPSLLIPVDMFVHFQGTSPSFLLLLAGNRFMVQRHPCCSLRVPEDCVSYRER